MADPHVVASSEARAAALVLARAGAVGETAKARLPPAWQTDSPPEGMFEVEREMLLRAPPDGLALVHPSWLPGWLPGEAPRGTAAVRLYLARLRTAQLVAMPVDGLPAMPVARLDLALRTLGAARLALALGAVPRAAQAQVVAALGGHDGALLMTALAAPAAGSVGTAVRELGGLALAAGGRTLLVAAAARHLGPALAVRGDLARQLAQRLPREVGLALLAEARAEGDIAAAEAALAALTTA